MRFAYADPPYVGQARRHYNCDEVDHAALINRLVAEFPDGWALSCTSGSLRFLLPLCPEGARVGAWVKPFASFKRGVGTEYCWEPVIWTGGRKRSRKEGTVRDFVSVPIGFNRDHPVDPKTGKAFIGTKPYEFCVWLFRMWNAKPGDELVDLFPGSGAVTRAWESWTRQGVLWSEAR